MAQLYRIALVTALLFISPFITAHSGHVDWVYIGGQVYSDGVPVCALVLANGQSMFSCAGDGRYDLEVPLDERDQVTVQVFASGFAPFSQVFSPQDAAEYRIEMARVQDGRDFRVSEEYIALETPGRALVRGTVVSEGVPICTLVLANGQRQFTCGASLGEFQLDVPVDADGNITLMVFAAGFQPYKTIEPAPESITPPPGSGNLVVEATSDAINGDTYTIRWNFPDDLEYDLWLYVGGGAEWRHVLGTEESTDRGNPVQALRNTDNFCFMMTAVAPGSGGPPWPVDGQVLHSDLSGTRSPCSGP